MLLPENFVFTQNNLQDYIDCNRRFYYREILHLEWPAVDSEPIREQEELMELGTRFHLLCQQYLSGIPVDVLNDSIDHPELSIWWQNFLDLNLNSLTGTKYVEKLFTVPFANYRLAAKFDLLLVQPGGEFSIYDWKTSQRKPQPKYLLSRMQSKVYPFLLLNLQQLYGSIDPGNITMTYCYPAFPTTPITINYSLSRSEEDRFDLQNLIAEISKMDKKEFEKTEDSKKCSFCRYRSLCERGISAGECDPLESEASEIFDLDFGAL